MDLALGVGEMADGALNFVSDVGRGREVWRQEYSTRDPFGKPTQWGAPVETRDDSPEGNVRFYTPSLSPLPVAPVFVRDPVQALEQWEQAKMVGPLPHSVPAPILPPGAQLLELNYWERTGSAGDWRSNYMIYRYKHEGLEYQTREGRLPVPGTPVLKWRDSNPQATLGFTNPQGDEAAHGIANQWGAPMHPLNLSGFHPKAEDQMGELEAYLTERMVSAGAVIDLRVTDVYKPGEKRPYERRVEWLEHLPGGGTNVGRVRIANPLPPGAPGGQPLAPAAMGAPLTPNEQLLLDALGRGGPLTGPKVYEIAKQSILSDMMRERSVKGLKDKGLLVQQPDGSFAVRPPQPAGFPGLSGDERSVFDLIPAGRDITYIDIIRAGQMKGMTANAIDSSLAGLGDKGAVLRVDRGEGSGVIFRRVRK
jgi:hypothetical protein